MMPTATIALASKLFILLSLEVSIWRGIVRANSVTLPKRQNRISRPLIFLHFSGSI